MASRSSSADSVTHAVHSRASAYRPAIIRNPYLRGPLSWRHLLALAVPLVLIGWLLVKAPPWSLARPVHSEGVRFLTADGSLIARKGGSDFDPVDADELPDHVTAAFVAIEDRRFYGHAGIDPRGLARATWRNLLAGSVTQGGSTLTQQFVKTAYLAGDRTMARKLQEIVLAIWVDAWLTKDRILSRYLSSVYFGDGATGLEAASHHYFSKRPEQLTVAEAALLAGLVKAPSRLAPTKDPHAAEERMRLVLDAMVQTGALDAEEAGKVRPPRLRIGGDPTPEGTYFVDWVAQGRPLEDGTVVRTTLDPELQRRAVAAFSRADLGDAQAALVAMRPDGRVVAMLGGRSYQASPFNRATQAKRQPGSAFKLFVYFAAIREGFGPDNLVWDGPVKLGNWQPENADGRYRGVINLREAFGESSNVAAIRLAEVVGREKVIEAARDLGVTSELPDQPSLTLGVGTMSLLELTSAYAAMAAGEYPVKARGIVTQEAPARRKLDRRAEWLPMLDYLWHAANVGTGRRAALSDGTFGKTGTSQNGRDAVFVGFTGDLIVGVWVGRDDNKPMRGASGGRQAASIWRDFMQGANPGPGPYLEALRIAG